MRDVLQKRVQRMSWAIAAMVLVHGCATPPVTSPETANSWPFISIPQTQTNEPAVTVGPPVPSTNGPVLSTPAINEPQASVPSTTNAPPAATVPPAGKVPPVATVPPAMTIPAPPVVRHMPVPVLPAGTWLPCESWSTGAGWSRPERMRNVHTVSYELRGSHGVLEITAGNRTVLWNGIGLELGFAPRATNGQPYLHRLDLAKTLGALCVKPAILSKPNRSVVIDPGHGGENYGAKSAVNDKHEKDYALDWAFRVERLLIGRGWKVHLTRTNDVEIPLPERIAFADRVGADLFISLHFNSTPQNRSDQGQGERGGVETYCLTPVGMTSTLTRGFDDEAWHAFPNNAFDSENYYFAARLHRAMVGTTQRKDRGVRRARFMGVLQGQNRPAVLLEGGYLTYVPEARLIATAEYRQKLAEAVAQGLQ